MRRALSAPAAVAAAVLTTLVPGHAQGAASSLTLGHIVRITTPGTTPCAAEGEPEVTRTRLGIWVAYNDDHDCPWLPTSTRAIGVQLVRPQGPPVFVQLGKPSAPDQIYGGDPDLAPAPDGGVFLATLVSPPDHVASDAPIAILHIDNHFHVDALPTPSIHPGDNFDDKEFFAVDNDPRSPYAGRLYAAWGDLKGVSTTVFRAWNGQHWATPVKLMRGFGEPDVAIGPHGVVAVAMQSGRGVVIRISHDGGRRFSKATLAIAGGAPGRVDPSCPLRPTVGIRQRASMGPRVAFDAAGDLHVVAAIGASTHGSGEVVSAPAVVQQAVLRGAHVIHEEPVTPPTSDEHWAGALAALPSGGIAVSWLQTNGVARDTYDAWIAVERNGKSAFGSAQRLSVTSSTFPAATEAVGNSNCYGIGDYIGMTTTPDGVATVWPTTDTDAPGVDSDVLLRTATPH